MKQGDFIGISIILVALIGFGYLFWKFIFKNDPYIEKSKEDSGAEDILESDTESEAHHYYTSSGVIDSKGLRYFHFPEGELKSLNWKNANKKAAKKGWTINPNYA